MCMKYVNANASCYKSITTYNDRYLSYDAPFESIPAVSGNEDECYVDDFKIITNINFLGTNNDQFKADNVLVQREKLNVMVRVTKCAAAEQDRLCLDLDKYDIDLSEYHKKGLISHACFDFLDTTRITNVNRLRFPGTGKYVIKILIKKDSDSDYSIQSMSKLIIEKPKCE